MLLLGSRRAGFGLGSCRALIGCTELSCVAQGPSEGKKPLDEAEDQVEQSWHDRIDFPGGIHRACSLSSA